MKSSHKILYFKPNFKNLCYSYLITFLLILSITWIFNYGNQFSDFKVILDPLLGNSVLIAAVISGIFTLRNRIYSGIIVSAILTMFFIFLNLENSVLTSVWDLGYPVTPFRFEFYNMPPIDPFQQIGIFGILFCKSICEKITLNVKRKIFNIV